MGPERDPVNPSNGEIKLPSHGKSLNWGGKLGDVTKVTDTLPELKRRGPKSSLTGGKRR